MTGRFITFEGGEGSGKSTQLALLKRAFEAAGLACLSTREPGGSPGGEQIRALLVNGAPDSWDPVAETLLFYAARLDHVNRLIRPALDSGKTVLCDRFADSTMVYQGIGKQLSEEYIHSLHRLTLGHFAPDVTLVFDIDPAAGLQRASARKGSENRFESMDFDFHQAVRTGFLAIAQREPERCAVVDASAGPAQVHDQVVSLLNQRLGLGLKAQHV
jgi:dTMP kinase